MRRRSASIKGPYAKVRCSAASIADKLPSARCSATPHTACSTDAATARAAATAAATAATAAVPAAVPVPPPPLPGWAKAKSRTASAAASSALLTATRASGPDALPVAAAAPCFYFILREAKARETPRHADSVIESMRTPLFCGVVLCSCIHGNL
jgi:hypothetical protein